MMMVGRLVLLLHLLAAVWFFYFYTHRRLYLDFVTLCAFYTFLQSNMYLRQLKLPIFVFGSVTVQSSKLLHWALGR